VREAAGQARVVKVSLSAWNQHSFEWVNRPHRGLDFTTMLDGLRDFRKGFDGQLWLEVFLLNGINAMPKDVEKIARLARDLKPDRIHLNTIVRPPADEASILAMLERRPCTINQISAAFGMHINEVSKILGHLMRSNRIGTDLRNAEVYYTSLSITRPSHQGPVNGPKKD
jgi:wyosine [tRNA(Phe)-imidazoG37] synthetase (radical SAM superfamily)